MYVLIADSGSTKTDWVLLRGTQIIKRVKTIGFNPYFQSIDQISLEILNNLKPHLIEDLNKIKVIHYYGAGCSTFENCKLIEDCLTITLGVAKIQGDSVAHFAHLGGALIGYILVKIWRNKTTYFDYYD